MALDVQELLARRQRAEIPYGEREVMLYALSLGLGSDPLNEAELRYVYEEGLLVVPTFVTILAFSARMMKPTDELDFSKLLHGEQRLELHHPLPASGTAVIEARVKDIIDKGTGKGLLITQKITIASKDSGEQLAALEGVGFYRGDGGRTGITGSAPPPHRLPERAPDAVVTQPTRPDQALLYRLNGDRNPLHAEPAFAKRAGFERPILHGLCTYGIACCAVLRTYCPGEPGAIRSFDVRFSAPVFPGETLRTELWRDGDLVSFRTRAQERDLVVLNNGRCRLA